MALLNGAAVQPINGVVSGTDADDTIVAEATDSGITLDGGSGNDVLFSEEGADSTTLDGGSGHDVLAGGGTNDTASYAKDPAGVVVDLSSTSATDGTGGIDTLVGIENVTGSAFNDRLTGDDLANVLNGGAGDDTLAGGGGDDVFRYSFDRVQEGETFTDFIGQGGDALADNFYTQNVFATQYTAWLRHLVDTNELGSDLNGDGIVEVGLNQNDAAPDATPFIEGVSAEDLAAMFTDRDSVQIKTGKVTQERFYSNSFSTGEGQDAVTSTDGFDAIVDFDFAQDKLDFDGLGSLTVDEFRSLFKVTVVDADNDGTIDDTQLALLDNSWGVSLLDDNGAHGLGDFHDNIFA